MTEKKIIDWEAVEREYRAGVLSLREIASGHPGVNHVAIARKAKNEGWEKDLSAKIKAKTDTLVTRQAVTADVTANDHVLERQIVDANAGLLADAVINQRSDIKRARATAQKLWLLVDAELDHPEEFANLGALLASPDEFGQDKRNEMYRAAIGLPQQIKNVKLLADAIKVLIELERRVLKIDEIPDSPFDAAAAMSDAQRVSRIASILARARARALGEQ